MLLDRYPHRIVSATGCSGRAASAFCESRGGSSRRSRRRTVLVRIAQMLAQSTGA